MCEMPDIYSCYTPVSKKEHKCCECRGVIFKGEKYYRHQGLWGGEFATYKRCIDCEKIVDEINSHRKDWEDRVLFELLYEDIQQQKSIDYLKKYVETKKKRGAKIHDWMIEKMNSCEQGKEGM